MLATPDGGPGPTGAGSVAEMVTCTGLEDALCQPLCGVSSAVMASVGVVRSSLTGKSRAAEALPARSVAETLKTVRPSLPTSTMTGDEPTGGSSTVVEGMTVAPLAV